MRDIIKLILCLVLLLAGNAHAGMSQPKLVFAANADGNWDLFSVDEDGKNLVRLTSTPYDEKDPAWSYDGTKVVYATSDGQLNILDINTKEHEQPVTGKQTTARFSPVFSPDDKQIAFIQFKPGGNDDTELKIYNIETKRSRVLLDQYSGQFWPAWSPDGSRIVYTNNHCAGDCGKIIQELWIADTSGGYARQLLMTNSLSQQAAWSPDGRKIAFSSDKSGNFDIWILSLKDWKLEQITTHENLDVSPAWSQDGKKIAFISTRSGRMEIWIKNLKTGQLKRLRPFGDKKIECKDVAWY